MFILLAVAAAAAWWATKHFSQRSDENGTVVRVSGNIEVTDAEVSFKIPGRVEARAVTEGERVQAGQVGAHLEKSDLAHEVVLRRAEVAVVQTLLAELEAGTRSEEIA